MEYLAKVSDWRDDRGFGFITPLQGDAGRVFFHVGEYPQSGRRPELGELVKYVASHEGGRWKATSVSRTIAGRKSAAIASRKPAAPSRIPVWIQYVLLGGYIGGLSWAVSDDRLPIEL